MNTKNIVITVLILVLIGAVGFLLTQRTSDTVVEVVDTPTPTEEVTIPVEPNNGIGDGAQPLPEVMKEERGPKSTLGNSAGGTAIEAFHFGVGENEVLFVGGVHGSYAPNTTKLANELVAYFEKNPQTVPDNVSVTIIPTLNPDGAKKSDSVDGRFNANDVDLNRNFNCEWAATGTWRDRQVSGGSAAFSEPEAAALRDYVQTYQPKAAVVWFSAEGKVYPSACGRTPGKASVTLAATFAAAAGYPAEAEFDAYPVTGDMVNWMADEGVTAISVLLSDYTTTEFSKNQAGVEAVLASFKE